MLQTNMNDERRSGKFFASEVNGSLVIAALLGSEEDLAVAVRVLRDLAVEHLTTGCLYLAVEATLARIRRVHVQASVLSKKDWLVDAISLKKYFVLLKAIKTNVD